MYSIGKKEAAPKLLEMMARQEGFAGGYYTGIATIHDKKLYHAKVIGDLSTLINEANDKELPGSIGIIHSRSKSGGDIEWSHPFVDEQEQMAYIANGMRGVFTKEQDQNAIAQMLVNSGHIFKSKTQGVIEDYPLLSDGTSIHFSDVMCHLIESFITECGGPIEAMRKAFVTFPSEIVGLMVHTDIPDCIVASRINQPLVIGRDEEATYLATTAIALPDVHWSCAMPTNATAAVYREKIHVLPFESPPKQVAYTLPWYEGYQKIIHLLSDGEPRDLGTILNATASLWPKDVVSQKDMMGYEILYSLNRSGKVRFQTITVDGVLTGITAPKKQVILEE